VLEPPAHDLVEAGAVVVGDHRDAAPVEQVRHLPAPAAPVEHAPGRVGGDPVGDLLVLAQLRSRADVQQGPVVDVGPAPLAEEGSHGA
jgi:hypothetical protein